MEEETILMIRLPSSSSENLTIKKVLMNESKMTSSSESFAKSNKNNSARRKTDNKLIAKKLSFK